MIKFNDLGKQWETIRESVLDKIDEIGYSGQYINGEWVSKFEQEFSNHYGSKYGIGVSNGTDGLKLALQIFDLNNNDVVIMPANTFIANYLAVKQLPQHNKPKVVLIDHDEYFNIDIEQLEMCLLEIRQNYRKVIVIPVHLYGHPCNVDKIWYLSDKYAFDIIEDCSQSHESKSSGQYLGTKCDLAVYSLYPGKNIGAMGDAGIITTSNKEISDRLIGLRNYGSTIKYHYDEMGHNNRLDSIQAMILSEKLKYIHNWIKTKIIIANRFLNEIKNEKIILPKISNYCDVHSFHVFCLIVDDRINFEKHMLENQIPTIIHYPIPIHKTKIFDEEHGDLVFSSENTDNNSKKIISIPIHPFLTEEEIGHIIKTINNF